MDEVAHKDRSTGLVVFGVLQIVIGAACAALLLGAAAGAELAARRGQLPVSAPALASSVFVWGVAAAYFVTAGIGSIRARRWARALSVAVSGLWLVGGIVGTIATAVLLPSLAPGLPLVRIVVFVAALFVLVPLALFLFYNRLDVGVTCDRRDPKRRWTDRVPLAVLALVIVMAFTALWLLVNLSNPIVPLFGTMLTGGPAAITLLAIAALCAFLAVQLFRLKESAWWTVVLLQIVGCTLTIGAMTRGVGEADPMALALMVATWIGYFAFLLYVRRYFVGGRLDRPREVVAG